MRHLAITSILLLVPAVAHAQLFITEVQPNPAGDDTAEWVELHNVGTASIAIGGYTLNDFVGSSDPMRESTTRWAFPATATVAPGQVIVVARQATSNGFFELFGFRPTYELGFGVDDPMTPDMVPDQGNPSPISLSNSSTGDAIVLRDAMGNVIDGVEWGTLDRSVPGNPADSPGDGETLIRIGMAGSSFSDFLITSTPGPFMGFGANVAPAITDVRTIPRHIQFGDTLTVTATVVDGDGLSLVEFWVTTATAARGPAFIDYQSLTMTSSTGNKYVFSASVDNLAAGLGFNEPMTFHERYVRFYLAAEDVLTSTATQPARAIEAADNGEFMQRNVMPTALTTIENAREQDAGGRTRYLNHSVRVRGIALSAIDNFDPDRAQFSLMDGTAAIQVFDFDPTIHPMFNVGDELTVTGRTGQFFGTTQIQGPGMRIIPTGMTDTIVPRTLTIGQLMTDPETYESQLVTIVDADFLQPITMWSTACPGRGCNIEITDGSGNINLRIWAGTGLDMAPAPQFGFDVTGVLSQRATDGQDGTMGGYQLFPRRSEDILAHAPPPPPDAGVVDTGPTPDSGTGRPDAGAGFADATTTPAADTGGGGGMGAVDDEGCSCTTNAPARGHAGWLAAVLGLLVTGRAGGRRRRVARRRPKAS